MKHFLGCLMLFLFVAVVPVFAQETEILQDTNWAMLSAEVKAGTMTLDQARTAAKSIETANAEAQAFNKNGEYEKAAEATPFTHAEVWYRLSMLRTLMGGHRNDDGHWNGYNTKCTCLDKEKDTWECKFNGSLVIKAACVKLAGEVIALAKTAKEGGLNPTGTLDADNAAKMAQNYLDTWLK